MPNCVFLPSSDEILADGLAIILRNDAQFGVRSGGHMPVPGAASTTGVLIALNNFRNMALHADQGYASISPGLVWGEVYSWLNSTEYRVHGGRVYSVGLSLILGGGLGYFSGQIGWAANSVRNFHCVLANGTIVDANANQNSDLWWALKGGSGNYAIVTRYDLQLYPQNEIFGGTVSWASEHYNDYINAHAAFIAPGGGSSDPKAAIMANLQVNCLNGALSAGTTNVYDAPVENPQALENFTSIPAATGSWGVQRFVNISDSTEIFSSNALRQLFYDVSLRAVPESIYIANRTVLETAARYLGGMNVSVGAAIQPLTTLHMQAARDRGGDPMDLNPANGGITGILVYAIWADESLDEAVQFWAQQTIKEIRFEGAKANITENFDFLNDAGLYQDPIATYGDGNSLGRMREIALRYDPDGVFQTKTGGFKLYTI